ncbi:MAG: hypothetical protein FOGNACKC_05405 [Anaerolineae bacterium]|nr:hypothetical protein [Anaerolineae bacterium]
MALLSGLIAWLKLNWILLTVLSIIAGAFIFLRNSPSDIASADELSRLLFDGKPTVIEFYSNF